MNLNELYHQNFLSFPMGEARAPGRINLIGEHVDYTGGYSLPAAINKETKVVFGSNEQNLVQVYSVNFSEKLEVKLSELNEVKKFTESWKNYVWGFIQLFHQEVGITKGISMAISGDVPMGKGISSSASLELAVLNALNYFYGQKLDGTKLCLLGQKAEHEYAGVKCGLLDQFASQFSQKNKLMLVDFRDLTLEEIPVSSNLNDYAWVLVDSLVSRELASSGYSDRVRECKEGLELSKVSHYRDLTLEIIESNVKPKNSVAAKRLEHYVRENDRTKQMAGALGEGNLNRIGVILNAGHESLSQMYEVSLPILDQIQKMGISIDGCIGGRMMGGGFGGCVLFLVAKNKLESFEKEMLSYYQKSFGKEGDVLKLELSDGASVKLY